MLSELSDGDSALLTVSWFPAGRGQQKIPISAVVLANMGILVWIFNTATDAEMNKSGG